MRIDLHAHSWVSDGTETPRALVHRAARADLDVLALTDHDTVAGWDEAAGAALEVGLTLVPGIEVSTLLRGRSVHLLAYLPDPGHAGLAAALEDVLAAREARLPRILAGLQAAGIELTEEDVRRLGPETVVPGRPHVADALVEAGLAPSRGEAMQQLLAPGTPGWVPRTAVDLVEAVRLVREAGGASVLAHPWGRSARGVLDAETVEELAGAGLAGVEVDHPEHSPAARAELRELATSLDLVVTGSSDHHGRGKVGHELGSETTDPEQYERLLAAAAAAADRAGREATRPVRR